MQINASLAVRRVLSSREFIDDLSRRVKIAPTVLHRVLEDREHLQAFDDIEGANSLIEEGGFTGDYRAALMYLAGEAKGREEGAREGLDLHRSTLEATFAPLRNH